MEDRVRRTAINLALLVVVAAGSAVTAGCDAPWVSRPAPDEVITVSTLPPDDDPEASRKAARSFLRERADDGTIYALAGAIRAISGGWEKGTDRAFVATDLNGARATSENGRLIATAFASWTNSETGRGRVSVFAENGELLYAGHF
ncbi:hypothetical protein ABZZ36_31850 [Actinacidiphila glaucinigra]|uniref:hypothetical protein n=1 Tax=Actinacidiphila glaucinigra TaxID=235986 RepID=UPI0033B9BC07